MASDVVKSSDRGRAKDRSKPGAAPQVRASNSGRGQNEAIEAIRSIGNGPVSVTVAWDSAGERQIAFEMPGSKAAELVRAAIGDKRVQKPKRLSPNSSLAEALREGRDLDARFSSAEDLFDALESEERL